MNASQEGNALTIDGERRVPLAFADEKAEQRLRARLSTGQAMSVRIAPTEPSDVQGHSLDLAKDSIWLKLMLEGDDTEGHAIRVTFPSAADADKFRRNMLAAGVLAGSIVLASAGAIALTSNLSFDASAPVTTQAQYMAPAQQEYAIPSGINPATNMPWRSGFQDGSDEGLSGAGAAAGAAAGADAAAPVLQRPEGRGPLETVE
jgi:hypothetical protein